MAAIPESEERHRLLFEQSPPATPWVRCGLENLDGRFLEKPFTPGDLSRRIRQVLADH